MGYFDQVYQIDGSRVYDDAISNAHLVGIAEAQGDINGDLNILRTQQKDLKGTTHWYDTTSDNIEGLHTRVTNFENVRRVAEIVLSPAIASGTSNVIDVSSLSISTIADYVDESGSVKGILSALTNVTGGKNLVSIKDANGDPVDDGNGNYVYGYLVVDSFAAPTTEQVYFYSLVSGTETSFSFTSSINLTLSIRRRYDLKDINEDYAVKPNSFFNLAEEVNVGDRTYTENNILTDKDDITTSLNKVDIFAGEVYSLFGIAVGNTAMGYTSTFNIITNDDVNTAISKLDSAIGDRTSGISIGNYVTPGDNIVSMIDSLDVQLKTISDNAGSGPSIERSTLGTSVTTGTTLLHPSGTPFTDGTLILIINGETLTLTRDYSVSNGAIGEITFNRDLPSGLPILWFVTK